MWNYGDKNLKLRIHKSFKALKGEIVFSFSTVTKKQAFVFHAVS